MGGAEGRRRKRRREEKRRSERDIKRKTRIGST